MGNNTIQSKFWSIITALLLLPVSNSALYNTSNLCKELIHNLQLKKEKTVLLQSKKELESKIREYKSESGIKRAIKEEINLVEANEVVIKIVKS